MINNFDKSSSGIDLELSVFFDLDLSRHYFEESIKRVGDLFFFVGGSNIVPDESDLTWDLTKTTAKDLLWLYSGNLVDYKNNLESLRYSYNSDPIRSIPVDDVLSFISDDLGGDQYMREFLADNFDPLFIEVTTTGYCQGDYATVILLQSVIDELGLINLDQWLQKEIDHLFWDAPIFCRLTVNGDEYELAHHLPDLYDYDQDQIIEAFNQCFTGTTKDRHTISAWLEDNLPDQPEYI